MHYKFLSSIMYKNCINEKLDSGRRETHQQFLGTQKSKARGKALALAGGHMVNYYIGHSMHTLGGPYEQPNPRANSKVP
jgi:hypothetical protein